MKLIVAKAIYVVKDQIECIPKIQFYNLALRIPNCDSLVFICFQVYVKIKFNNSA